MESTIRLSCDVRSVSEARHFVADLIERWHGPIDVSDAELLTSEVVTNAVIHGRSDLVLAVRYDPATNTVTIEVYDRGSDLPDPRPDDPQATSGRGLAIVGQVADDWGVTDMAGDGKVVWFALKGA
ncbi:MAG: ATP-binding protein [Acidimicrobiales bacterium]